MSFQCHESTSPANPPSRLQLDNCLSMWQNCHTFPKRPPTFRLSSVGNNLFCCYNIQPWTSKPFCIVSKPGVRVYAATSANSFCRNLQVKIEPQLARPWPLRSVWLWIWEAGSGDTDRKSSATSSNFALDRPALHVNPCFY